MFHKLFFHETTRDRHHDAPFADERERYLQHCAEQGATRATLRVKSNELLWIARHLDASAPQGINIEKLQDIVRERQSAFKGATTGQRLIDIGRPRRCRAWYSGAMRMRRSSLAEQTSR
jgi:integrase/recombinase XerD